MKYMTTLLLCFAIIICGCEKKQEISEEYLKLVIETINEMNERRKELFDNCEFNPEDSLFLYPEIERGVLVKVVGENNTFSEVCNNMSDLCSPQVTEKIIQEIYMYNINGEIYMHAAAGLPSYEKINDLSQITVLSVEDNIITLIIKRYYFLSNDKDKYIVSKYVVQSKDEKPYIVEYEQFYRPDVNTKTD